MIWAFLLIFLESVHPVLILIRSCFPFLSPPPPPAAAQQGLYWIPETVFRIPYRSMKGLLADYRLLISPLCCLLENENQVVIYS